MDALLCQDFVERFHHRVQWVFGYGSLMWNPEFGYEESHSARLYGYHRALCLWSVRYRGTPENPGLVAGLAPGGCCRGMAFRFENQHGGKVLEYLYERELISDAYRPTIKNCYLENGKRVPALAFVSKTNHDQYAERMPTEDAAAIVANASGPRGSNRDYVQMTVSHLDSLGIRETELHRIASLLD